MKMPDLIKGLIAGAFLALSSVSHAAPPDAGFHGRFHGGFGVRSAGTALRVGPGVRRNFALNQNRRFFDRGHRLFFQPLVWPAYWYAYGYPDDYSDLDYGPDDNYQYSDDPAASGQPDSSKPAADRGPILVIINKGNSWPMDSSPNSAHINGGSNNGYILTDATGQQRIVMQDPNEKMEPGTTPRTFVPPAETAQTPAKAAQTPRQEQAGTFGNLVLVSWLDDDGKYVLYVQNTETNDVQKITTEPNLDNFRIVELHPNIDPKLFEAVISNGSQQGSVRFRF
jgi:hypothetical protein